MSELEPDCGYGFSWYALEEQIHPDTYAKLEHWMTGQTMALCTLDDGSCRGGHGPVVYPWDFRRFLEGGPILD